MSAANEFYGALYYWQWRFHDFWAQVAIVALLQGFDVIGEAREQYAWQDGDLSVFLDICWRTVQAYINPTHRELHSS